MITFYEKAPGIKVARLENKAASAEISLYGAHVLSYVPAGQKDALFMSAQSLFAPGKAIRGGIPVCWPWFGPRPDQPTHGFARTQAWELVSLTETPDRSEVTLGCASTAETRALWPHDFRLRLTISVGAELVMTLVTENAGKDSFAVTDALHSYFAVSEVTGVRTVGLDKARYIDRVGGKTERVQSGDIAIASEVDSVYLSADDCAVVDPGLKRRIVVSKKGFPDTVVWNPWVDKSRAMPDFADDEYHGMICVEAASALTNEIPVAPGAKVSQEMRVAVKPL